MNRAQLISDLREITAPGRDRTNKTIAEAIAALEQDDKIIDKLINDLDTQTRLAALYQRIANEPKTKKRKHS